MIHAATLRNSVSVDRMLLTVSRSNVFDAG